MKIYTERLVLEHLKETDLDFLHSIASDPAVMKYIRAPETKKQSIADLKKTMAFNALNPDRGYFKVSLKENAVPIGSCVLRFLEDGEESEIGYRIIPTAWGKGYATELAKGLIKYGFETLKLSTIVAVAEPEHKASISVMEKCGMEFVKTCRCYDSKLDLVYYRVGR